MKKIKRHLVKNWRKAHRWNSVRLSLGSAAMWGCIAALNAIWPAFAGVISIGWLAVGGVLMGMAIALGRVLKQPGLD